MISITKTTAYNQIKLMLSVLVILLLLFVHTSSFARDKQSFERTLPHMTIGIMGHEQRKTKKEKKVDHGSKDLTAAILKIQAEKGLASANQLNKSLSPEEHERGITIDNHHVEYKTDKRHYTLILTPGDRDYTKNMITVATQMDAAILVVSAVNGPKMPQTKERLRLAKAAGIPHIVVFISKADKQNDAELIEVIELEIRELLNHVGYPGDKTPIIVGSAVTALVGDRSDVGVPAVTKLIEAIDETPIPRRALRKPFLLPIDNIFDITGRGTVVTGRVERGIINVGDEVEIVGLGETKKSIVQGLKIFNKPLERAEAGDLVGVLLRGIEPEDIKRGQILSLPGSIKSHTQFEAEVYMFTKKDGGRHRPFFSGYKPQFYFKTADVAGEIVLPDDVEMVMPGDTFKFTIRLNKPLAIEEGLSFAVRDSDQTIGTGVITKIIE